MPEKIGIDDSARKIYTSEADADDCDEDNYYLLHSIVLSLAIIQLVGMFDQLAVLC